MACDVFGVIKNHIDSLCRNKALVNAKHAETLGVWPMCGHVHYGIYIATNTKIVEDFLRVGGLIFSHVSYFPSSKGMFVELCFFVGYFQVKQKLSYPPLEILFCRIVKSEAHFLTFSRDKEFALKQGSSFFFSPVDKHPIFLDFSFGKWQNLLFYVEIWQYKRAVWLSSVSTKSILS